MSSDSDASGLSLAAWAGRPRGTSRLLPPASARFNRSESHPSRPWSDLAAETGGGSVRREEGPPRSGGGRVDALPASRVRDGADRDWPPATAIIGSSSRWALERLWVTTASPPPR